MDKINKKINELKLLLKEYDKENDLMVTVQVDPSNHIIEVSEKTGIHEVDMGDSDGTFFESDDGSFGFGMFGDKKKDS